MYLQLTTNFWPIHQSSVNSSEFGFSFSKPNNPNRSIWVWIFLYSRISLDMLPSEKYVQFFLKVIKRRTFDHFILYISIMCMRTKNSLLNTRKKKTNVWFKSRKHTWRCTRKAFFDLIDKISFAREPRSLYQNIFTIYIYEKIHKTSVFHCKFHESSI